MTLSPEWRALHRTRFADLPLDCGNDRDPGIHDNVHLRDWTAKRTSRDQARIERYVDRHDLRQRRILHIGMGNSDVARHLHRRVGEIVGTTIDEPEIEVARALNISNFRYILHNKFGGDNELVPGSFDFIIDNNPTSPCCCLRHFAALLDFYRKKLRPDGMVVTDRQGLGWVPEGFNPRWKFDFEDLAATAALAGLSTYRATRTIYVLTTSRPRRPNEHRSTLGSGCTNNNRPTSGAGTEC